MRKLSCLVLCAVLAFSLCSCGGSPTAGSDAPDVDNTAANDEADVLVDVIDLQSNLNQWHHYAVDVSHEKTGEYLTAEVYAAVVDTNGNILGEKTVFVNNLGAYPYDWESVPFLAKTAPDVRSICEIVSCKFTDGYTPIPEVSDSNVKQYLRLTSEYLGDVVGGAMEITADLHNLTPQYCTGTITFTATDDAGNVFYTQTDGFQNINPFGTQGFVVWVPVAESYTLDYTIDSFAFSENPS